MSYRLLITKQVASRVEQHLEVLHADPRPFGVKKLKGYTNTYRMRVGNYRIIYSIDDGSRTVTLLTIDNRKDVYR